MNHHPDEIERMRELHYEHSAADVDGDYQPGYCFQCECCPCACDANKEYELDRLDDEAKQDKLQEKLAETYERLRQTNDTQAIRRVNQQTKALLGRMGFRL